MILTLTRPANVISTGGPLLTIGDILFMPSALCLSPLNPAYIPVIGSGPCIPIITWLMPSTTVIISGLPALSINSKGMCNTGKGVIIPIPTVIHPIISK